MRKFYLLTILFVSYSIFTNAQTKTQVLVDIHATMGDFISDLNNAGDVSDKDRQQAIYNMGKTFGSPEYFMYNGEQRGSLQSWLQSYFKDNIRDVDVQHTLAIKEQSLVKKDVNNHSDKRWSFEGTLERNLFYHGTQMSVFSEPISLTIVWNGENKYVSIVALDGQLKQLSHVEEDSTQDTIYHQDSVIYKQHYYKSIQYVIEHSDEERLRIVRKGNKWGFIDNKNNIVIPIIYDYAYSFREGVTAVKKGKKWGVIDEENNIVTPFIYEEVYEFREGLAAVKEGNKWGFIDKENNIVIPTIYDGVYSFDENGSTWVKMNGKYGVINKENNIVVPCIYETIKYLGGGLWKIKKNKKWGVIDKNDNNIVIPCIYEEIGDLYEGVRRVKKEKKWGFIDKENNIVIPTIYEEVGDFHEERARVKKNKKWGFIDKENNIVIPCIYVMVGDFHEGSALVITKKNSYRINKSGK